MWKLGDFDAHRKEGEAVGGYTAQYSPPEVAKAVLTGAEVLAERPMDIFSFGLVALEMLRGAPLISASASKQEALSTLSSDGLEATLNKAMEPLPPQLKALLKKMLQASPAERKLAVDLKNSSVLTGNVRGPLPNARSSAHVIDRSRAHPCRSLPRSVRRQEKRRSRRRLHRMRDELSAGGQGGTAAGAMHVFG